VRALNPYFGTKCCAPDFNNLQANLCLFEPIGSGRPSGFGLYVLKRDTKAAPHAPMARLKERMYKHDSPRGVDRKER
jgi:hypothetical protein